MSSNLSPFEYFVCGGFGGICTVLVGHPLDTVKVRLQTMATGVGPAVGGNATVRAPLYTGTFDCISKIVKNEGFRGLYKGMAAPLTGVSPIFAISFMGFGVGKKIFGAEGNNAALHRVFAAGAFSGIFTTVIMAPGERIKCLLQIQQGVSPAEKKYNGMLDCARKLYATGGIRSLYRGTIATLLRDVPASGLYFATYQGLCAALARGEEKSSVLVTIFAGGMAGIANWVVGMPADVLKSRLQTAPEGKYPHGLRDVFVELMRHEGPTALYKGFTPVMLRAFPANAACFVGFEACASAFRRLKAPQTSESK